jgi:hypothetical protein
MAYYVIDRFEGKIAVIVADDGRAFDVPKERLPKGCREGTVLNVEAAGRDSPDWSGAAIDEAERARRLERAGEALRRLGVRDPGGDVQL